MLENAAPDRSHAKSHLGPKALEQVVTFSKSASRAIDFAAFFEIALENAGPDRTHAKSHVGFKALGQVINFSHSASRAID